jgi:hypothetical protein
MNSVPTCTITKPRMVVEWGCAHRLQKHDNACYGA